jgi:hypothetical protein
MYISYIIKVSYIGSRQSLWNFISSLNFLGLFWIPKEIVIFKFIFNRISSRSFYITFHL